MAFNEVHNGRPETGSVSFTYILGFMLEGLPFAYTRQFKSSGGEVEIGAREELATGEVIFMGQPDIADHLSSVEAPDVQGPDHAVYTCFAARNHAVLCGSRRCPE